jgi:Domain of unknown function (DUF4423)
MTDSLFRTRLTEEFAARRQKNSRYSLRTFAAFLRTDHSSLSQVLRCLRGIPTTQIRAWGKKLGMTPEEIAVHVAGQHVPDGSVSRRQAQLRHWTAEAMAIVSNSTHWKIVQLSRSKDFQPDCRWIAAHINTTVDEVNVALSRLLRLRLMEMSNGRWKDLTGSTQQTESQFKKRALVRIRELAAEHGIHLRPAKTQ